MARMNADSGDRFIDPGLIRVDPRVSATESRLSFLVALCVSAVVFLRTVGRRCRYNRHREVPMTVAVPERAVTLNAESRVVLEPVSWALYEQILTELGDNRGTRLAYDDGRLEIMSPSDSHEDVKTIVARLIEAYAFMMDIDIQGYGSWTMNRKEKNKGIEPDECYYVQSLSAIAGKKRRDLKRDPPPDLAIEVDISRSSLAKQPIYAAIGVPEIWRFDGERFAILRRDESGSYVESPQSACFPDLPIDEVNRFVQIGLRSLQPAAVRALRDWVKQRRVGPE
jgi:Uma2 family endonuclease